MQCSKCNKLVCSSLEYDKAPDGCPTVEKKEVFQNARTKLENPEILKRASSGGFVTTIAEQLLKNKELSNIVMVQDEDDKPVAADVSNPDDVIQKAGVVYGRSGVLERLVELTGETSDPIGIVGVACEMRGAAEIEDSMKRDILKMGLVNGSCIRRAKE